MAFWKFKVDLQYVWFCEGIIVFEKEFEENGTQSLECNL